MRELLTPFLSYRAAPDVYGKGSTSGHLPGDTKGRGSVVRAAWPRSPRAAEARQLTTPRAQSSAWSGPGGFMGRILVPLPVCGRSLASPVSLRPPGGRVFLTSLVASSLQGSGPLPNITKKARGILRLRGCTHAHRRLQASRAWDPLPDRCTGRAAPSGAWRALLSKAGCERPQALRGRSVAPVLAKWPPHGEAHVRPGDAPQVLRPPAPAASAGRSRRAPSRAPARPPTAPTAPTTPTTPPPPALEDGAARAHWCARGPARGLAREGGRWGGGKVGRRRAAHPPGPKPAPLSPRGQGAPRLPSNERRR